MSGLKSIFFDMHNNGQSEAGKRGEEQQRRVCVECGGGCEAIREEVEEEVQFHASLLLSSSKHDHCVSLQKSTEWKGQVHGMDCFGGKTTRNRSFFVFVRVLIPNDDWSGLEDDLCVEMGVSKRQLLAKDVCGAFGGLGIMPSVEEQRNRYEVYADGTVHPGSQVHLQHEYIECRGDDE